jgi:hypothetical protein
MVSREKVYELVSMFYQSKFKTFYINSLDGEEFVQPTGVFVSLGMTTSLDQLNNITNAINVCDKYTAKLVEIKSEKRDGIFINTVTSETPTQYGIGETQEKLLNLEETEELIKKLNEQLLSANAAEMNILGKRLRRLMYLKSQLDSTEGWDIHAIQDLGDDFKIYHLKVNYKKESDTEYRIGILVNEKDS